MFVQCLEQVQHYTCHILLFSSLLIKHHLHSMLCYFIISQGVTVTPLFPPRSTLLPAASGMLQCWIGMGGAVGLLRNMGMLRILPFTLAWHCEKKIGKKRQMEGSLTPKDLHRELEHALGHEGKPCRSHDGCVCKVSVAQSVEGNVIPPNPAVSECHSPTEGSSHSSPQAPGHQGEVKGTDHFLGKLPLLMWKSCQSWVGSVSTALGVSVTPKIIATTASHQPLSGQGGSQNEIPSDTLQIHYNISFSSQSPSFFFFF